MLKQYCLEGILAKESSPGTKDFLLWSDLHVDNTNIGTLSTKWRQIFMLIFHESATQGLTIGTDYQMDFNYCTSMLVMEI